MHWLAEEVSRLDELARAHEELRRGRAAGEAVSRREESRARGAFLAALQEVVDAAAERPGVMASFAAHEGLLLATAGDVDDFEAVAAMAQWCIMPARSASETLRIGPLQQLLLVGREYKLALVQIGEMTLGMYAPAGVRLGEALSA